MTQQKVLARAERGINPKIGEPRLYDSPKLPVLYPGEQATAQMRVSSEQMRGTSLEIRYEAYGWLVEPAPGWHALWLRWRWRLIGRWLEARIREHTRVQR